MGGFLAQLFSFSMQTLGELLSELNYCESQFPLEQQTAAVIGEDALTDERKLIGLSGCSDLMAS